MSLLNSVKKAGAMLGIAISMFLAQAANAAAGTIELVTIIQNYTGGTSATGTLSATATADERTVTVTGTKTGATATLSLDITDSVTVIWKAELSGTAAKLLTKSGGGLLEVQEGSKIEQQLDSYQAYAINVTGGPLTISGGTVSTVGGAAVYNGSTGTMNIDGGDVSVISGDGYSAVYNKYGGVVNINGGTVSATGSSAYAVYIDNPSGTVNIKGGMVSATEGGYAVYNYSSGTVNISDGTVSATYRAAVYNNNDGGKVNISGGTVSATIGSAVYNGKITVSGMAKVTSENVTFNENSALTQGTIFVNSSSTFEMTGGTVENTGNDEHATAIYNKSTVNIKGGEVKANIGIAVYSKGYSVNITGGTVSAIWGHAVYNDAYGEVNIYGGDVSVIAGWTIYNNYYSSVNITGGTVSGDSAVYNTNANAVTLGGSPTINGRIKNAELSVANDFAPGSNVYTLDFASLPAIAVKNGAAYVSNFALVGPINGVDYGLFASNGNIILAIGGYVVAKSGTTYTISKGGTFTSIQDAINDIKTQANGADVAIQFGNGTDALDINEGIILDGGAGGSAWGLVTLAGNLTSSNSSVMAISLKNGVSVAVSSGAISAMGGAISNKSTGTVNISGGTISATNGSAVFNDGCGTANISGGTVTAGGNAVYNSDCSTLNISGGTVSSTNNRAVYYDIDGTVTISGGLLLAFGSYGGSVDDISAVIASMNAGATNATIEAGATIVACNSYVTTPTAFTSTGITKFSETATVVWANKDGKAGIEYTNGTNTGFIEVAGVTVGKAEGATVATPVLASETTHNSITITAVEVPKGANVSYAISTTNTAPTDATAWKTDLVFNGLAPETDYYIFARITEDENYNAGTVSAYLHIKTPSEGNVPIRHPQIAIGNIIAKATANSIVLSNLPANAKVEAYNLQGKQIYSTNSGNSKILQIQVQTKGIYIIKTSNQTMRVAVK